MSYEKKTSAMTLAMFVIWAIGVLCILTGHDSLVKEIDKLIGTFMDRQASTWADGLFMLFGYIGICTFHARRTQNGK